MENGTPSIPSLLGKRYQLQKPLATGGMAFVYKATDLWLERPVAIKILRQDYSSDIAFRQRFHHEAKAAANLSHPNIVTVYDFGLDQEQLYIVMEFVPGKDLKSLIKEHGLYNVNDALPLLIQACAGIGYAHRSGLIHCDVKPQNFLVTPDQRLKVTDFGIARALASIPADEQNEIVWGSPQYFSPEQAAGGAPSPASDVYSLGVIFYEMLAGRLPFISSDPLELARMHREVLPNLPHRYNPQIPPAVEQIIMKVLSKEPAARYRTADQLGSVLQSINLRSEEYTLSQPPAVSQPRVSQGFRSSPAPSIRPSVDKVPSTPVSIPAPPPLTLPPRAQSSSSDDHALDIDWLTTLLGLLCTLAVGGLIPFWLYIWFILRSLNPGP
jgi:eukaryotic-like serine/threonine-protein kinase